MKNIVSFLLLLFFVGIISEVPLNEFYPYGIENGDVELERGSDVSSSPQMLQYPFPFFDIAQPTLWVNENGILTFHQKVSDFTPWCSAVPPQYRMIAPFWADVDARYVGDIFYRQTTNETILKQAQDDIAEISSNLKVNLKWAFIATWVDVTYFIDLNDTNTIDRKRNSFQVTLVTDGTQSFVIFYYNEITWTTGDVSDGINGLGGTPAFAGYDFGDGSHRAKINGSCTSSILSVANQTNIESPGKYILQTNIQLVTPSPTPECQGDYTGDFCIVPNTIDLVGHIYLDITHIQLTTTQAVICRFNDPNLNVTEGDAIIVTLTHIKCPTPFFFITGRVQMELEIWDTNSNTNSTFNNTLIGYIYVTQPKEQTLHYKVLANESLLFTWDPEENDLASGKDAEGWLELGFTTICACASEGTTCIKHAKEIIHKIRKKDRKYLMPKAEQLAFNKLACSLDPREYACSGAWTLGKSVWDYFSGDRPYYSVAATDFAEWTAKECPALKYGCKLYSHYGNGPPSSLWEVPNDVPPCPPTLQLAQLDPGFIVDRHCNSGADCFFNPGSDICYDSATPSPSGGGQHCCYKSGQINLNTPGAGYPSIAHPSLAAGFLNYALDKIPYIYCCLQSGGSLEDCEGLYKHRHPDSGTNYSSPTGALGNGDPHFTTFDGLYYTFNGAGEFWLIKTIDDQPFKAQARFILPSGNSSSYSYLSAYALKSGISSVVQVELPPLTSQINVYYDSIPIPPNVLAETFMIDDVAIRKDGDTVFITFSNGFSFQFSPYSLTIYARNDYKGNYTRGILGIFDGNSFNDLETPYGVLIPANSTTEVIHYKFGMEWYVKPDESLFNYFGKNYSTYYFPHFKPSFGYADGQLPDNADEICEGDQSCLWDLVTTGDEAIANQTRGTHQEFNETKKTTSQNITMCSVLTNPSNGYCSVNNYMPGSFAKCSCNQGFEVMGDVNLYCSDDGNWNGTEPLCEAIITTTTIQPTTITDDSSTKVATSTRLATTTLLGNKSTLTTKETTVTRTTTHQPHQSPTTTTSNANPKLFSLVFLLISVALAH